MQKALMKEDISTWFPPLVGHSLEIIIVVMNLVNDLGGKGAGKKQRARPGGGATPESAKDGGRAESSSERTPLTGGDAAKVAAVNQAMERGESGGGGDDMGGGEGEAADALEDSDGDESVDWLEGLPRDKNVYVQGDYVYHKMCNDPKFLHVLVKYL